MITNDIRPLLDRYVRFIGRGNMVPASLVLVDIIKRLVQEIETIYPTNGQQPPRPYDVTAVNKAAIHCMEAPDLGHDEGNGADVHMIEDEHFDETDLEADTDPEVEHRQVEHRQDDDTPMIDAPPVRRSRGRPRKHPQV